MGLHVQDWFIQMVLALSYLHGQRILHRDIKPQNVFLSRNNTLAKLGDFGLTRMLDSTDSMASTMIGTPYYMSTELCTQQPYSFKSDVWSLGCVLYQMAALRVPFPADNFAALRSRILTAAPDPLPSRYTPQLSALVARLLHKDAAARPAIADVVADPHVQRHMQAFVGRHASLCPAPAPVPVEEPETEGGEAAPPSPAPAPAPGPANGHSSPPRATSPPLAARTATRRRPPRDAAAMPTAHAAEASPEEGAGSSQRQRQHAGVEGSRDVGATAGIGVSPTPVRSRPHAQAGAADRTHGLRSRAAVPTSSSLPVDEYSMEELSTLPHVVHECAVRQSRSNSSSGRQGAGGFPTTDATPPQQQQGSRHKPSLRVDVEDSFAVSPNTPPSTRARAEQAGDVWGEGRRRDGKRAAYPTLPPSQYEEAEEEAQAGEEKAEPVSAAPHRHSARRRSPRSEAQRRRRTPRAGAAVRPKTPGSTRARAEAAGAVWDEDEEADESRPQVSARDTGSGAQRSAGANGTSSSGRSRRTAAQGRRQTPTATGRGPRETPGHRAEPRPRKSGRHLGAHAAKETIEPLSTGGSGERRRSGSGSRHRRHHHHRRRGREGADAEQHGTPVPYPTPIRYLSRATPSEGSAEVLPPLSTPSATPRTSDAVQGADASRNSARRRHTRRQSPAPGETSARIGDETPGAGGGMRPPPRSATAAVLRAARADTARSSRSAGTPLSGDAAAAAGPSGNKWSLTRAEAAGGGSTRRVAPLSPAVEGRRVAAAHRVGSAGNMERFDLLRMRRRRSRPFSAPIDALAPVPRERGRWAGTPSGR